VARGHACQTSKLRSCTALCTAHGAQACGALQEFFPLLTELIGCEHAPPEVQVTTTLTQLCACSTRAGAAPFALLRRMLLIANIVADMQVTLSKLFSTRLGPLLQAQEDGK
jgi:hypothetical protein